MNISKFLAILGLFFLSETVSAQNNIAVNDLPKVSIISSDARFTRSAKEKNTGKVYSQNGSLISSYGFSIVKRNYYMLRFSIIVRKISDKNIYPLDIQLISPSGAQNTIHIEDDISVLVPGEINDFEIEIPFYKSGWYQFKIGENFITDPSLQNSVFTAYDKASLYVEQPPEKIINKRKIIKRKRKEKRGYKNGLR